MLDRPAFPCNRPLRIGGFVRRQDFVNRRVTHRMGRDAPAEAIQLFDDIGVGRLLHRVDAGERAVLAPRLGVWLAHPTALESTVDRQLHAADADPFVAFVRFHVERRHRRPHLRRVVRGDAHQLGDSNRQQFSPFHFLQQPILVDRGAGVSDARQTRRVQPAVLLEERFDRELRARRQLDERFRTIDQLAVQVAVGTARDAAAGNRRRIFGDVPFLQRRRIEDVLVATTNDDHRIVRRRDVEIVAVRQPMLGELGLVPVAVGDDEIAGPALRDARAERREHVGHRSRARQIHAGAAAGVVQMAVGETWNHRPRGGESQHSSPPP